MKVEVPEYEVAERLDVDPRRSVLLITDMQNDFAREGGALYNPAAAASIPVIGGLADRARQAGVPVWYSCDTHYEGDPEWEVWGRHVERGTPGWKIVEELTPEPGERVFEKNRYDAFYGTGLEHALRINHRDCLVISGTVANILRSLHSRQRRAPLLRRRGAGGVGERAHRVRPPRDLPPGELAVRRTARPRRWPPVRGRSLSPDLDTGVPDPSLTGIMRDLMQRCRHHHAHHGSFPWIRRGAPPR